MIYPIENKEIIIETEAGKPGMGAHIAYPLVVGHYPAVIVVMELFGVNNNIREITNKIAELGYVAIAPDFYYRSQLKQDIPYGDEGRKKGFEELHKLRRESVLNDIRSTMELLRSRQDVSERIGIVGFSMGGHIAYLAATQFNLLRLHAFMADG